VREVTLKFEDGEKKSVAGRVCAHWNTTQRDVAKPVPTRYLVSWSLAPDSIPSLEALENILQDTPGTIMRERTSAGYRINYVGVDYINDNPFAQEMRYCIEPWEVDPQFVDQGTNSFNPRHRKFHVIVEAIIKDSSRGHPNFGPVWSVDADCSDEFYLEASSEQMRHWQCESCPLGATCVGDVSGHEVKSMFGWQRLDAGESLAFWKCLNPKACLGGYNPGPEMREFEVHNKDWGPLNALKNESCNHEMGFRETCGSDVAPRRCRLCRACRFGYYPEGVGFCYACPAPVVRMIIVIVAIIGLCLMLYAFLKAALDEDDSPHSHLAQPLQKIALNHMQLIALAASLPLSWPPQLRAFFEMFAIVTRVGGYLFNPQCDAAAAASNTGSSKFFIKQLGILVLPFLAVVCSCIFWGLVAAYPRVTRMVCWFRLKRLFGNSCCCRAKRARRSPPTLGDVFELFCRFLSHEDFVKQHHVLSKFAALDLMYALNIGISKTACAFHYDKIKQIILMSAKGDSDAVVDRLTEHAHVDFESFARWYTWYIATYWDGLSKKKNSTSQMIGALDLVIHVVYGSAVRCHTIVTPIPTFAGDKGFAVKLDNVIPGNHGLECELLVFQQNNYGVILRHLNGNTGPGLDSRVTVAGSVLPRQTAEESSNAPPLEDRLRVSSLIESRLLDFEYLLAIDDLICIEGKDGTKTEILAEVVPRGRFHNVQQDHSAGSKHSTLDELAENTDVAYHVPTRGELLKIYEDALAAETKEDIDAGEEEGTVVFICLASFERIVEEHPDIFGALWRKTDLTSSYTEIKEIVGRDILSKYQDIFSGRKEASKQDFVFIATECFSIFAEFAFRVSMQRRHHHNKLKRARSLHSARRESVAAISHKVQEETRLKRRSSVKTSSSSSSSSSGATSQRNSGGARELGTSLKELKERDGSIGYVDKIVATVVTMLYLLYPTLCSSAFSILACQPVGHTKTYLQQDLEVECYAQEHTYWVAGLGAPAVLLLAFGIPVITFYLLRSRRHDLHSHKTRFRFSIIMIGYTDEAYYWECVVAVRKLSVAAIGVFMLQLDIAVQSLTAEVVVVAMLVMHIAKRPYIEVTPQHDTLHNAETAALTVSFLTLGCGMEMHEKLEDPVAQQVVLILCTTLVVVCNIIFICISIFWWLELKKMDLENLLEHSARQKKTVSRLVMWLQSFLPDWEGQGRDAELDRERVETENDMKELDLGLMFRVKRKAHKWVESFRERKRMRGTSVVSEQELRQEREIDERAVQDLVAREETETKRLRLQMEVRSERAHERLEQRKRKRLSLAASPSQMRRNGNAGSASAALQSRLTHVRPRDVDGNNVGAHLDTLDEAQNAASAQQRAADAADAAAFSSPARQLVRLCFPPGVTPSGFGFKLRQRREDGSSSTNTEEEALLRGFFGVASEAYAIEPKKSASRRGLRSGALLVKINGLPATQENVDKVLAWCGKKTIEFLFTESREGEWDFGDV
jgi:hypothetical protein